MNPTIRQVKPEDAADILAIYAPYITGSAVSFEETIPSVEEMVSRIESIRHELPFLVCEINGEIAGYAYATNHRNRSAYRWTKELSVYIHPDHRRHKAGKALYCCVTGILKYQGIRSVLAGITLPNPESVGFHEDFGFRKAAEFHQTGYKLGQWHSVGWWELDLSPQMAQPSPTPLPFSDIPFPVLDEITGHGIKMVSL